MLPRSQGHPCITCRRAQVQSKPHFDELRVHGACGKERTGFPQAGGADLFEIPYPVCPETWKRFYMLSLASRELMDEFGLRDLYWICRLPRPRLLPGRDCSKGLSMPQGIERRG